MARKITVSHKTAKISINENNENDFKKDDDERRETGDRMMKVMKMIHLRRRTVKMNTYRISHSKISLRAVASSP